MERRGKIAGRRLVMEFCEISIQGSTMTEPIEVPEIGPRGHR
jgi:hypothetical protein